MKKKASRVVLRELSKLSKYGIIVSFPVTVAIKKNHSYAFLDLSSEDFQEESFQEIGFANFPQFFSAVESLGENPKITITDDKVIHLESSSGLDKQKYTTSIIEDLETTSRANPKFLDIFQGFGEVLDFDPLSDDVSKLLKKSKELKELNLNYIYFDIFDSEIKVGLMNESGEKSNETTILSNSVEVSPRILKASKDIDTTSIYSNKDIEAFNIIVFRLNTENMDNLIENAKLKDFRVYIGKKNNETLIGIKGESTTSRILETKMTFSGLEKENEKISDILNSFTEVIKFNLTSAKLKYFLDQAKNLGLVHIYVGVQNSKIVMGLQGESSSSKSCESILNINTVDVEDFKVLMNVENFTLPNSDYEVTLTVSPTKPNAPTQTKKYVVTFKSTEISGLHIALSGKTIT